MSDMTALVKKHWDIKGLAKDLKAQKWNITEGPTQHGYTRIDRMIHVGSYPTIESLARQSVSDKEIAEAEKDDTLPELIDDLVQEYIDTLAEVVAKAMRKHVYGTFDAGDGYLGQYEEGKLDNLRRRFDIEES
jgi:hypothetical protein